MITSMKMEEDPSHMTERILDLTLEIIYLLTEENFPPVKSGDHITITVPSLHSLKLKRNNCKKILGVTKKIAELLTGESRNWSKFKVRIKEEIKEEAEEEDVVIKVKDCLEGQKDLYKDVMMKNQPPLTSPDGSSNGNPPERCPCPLYSRDSSVEDHTSLYKGINQSDWNNAIKDDIKEEKDEVGVMETFLEGPKNIMMEPFSDTNPPERCPRPLYSWDSTQEGHTIPHYYQGEEQINIKAEVKEEEVETYVGDEQPSREEVGMIMKSEEDDIFLPINTTDGCDMRNSSERHLLLSADCKSEDNVITQNPPGRNPNTQNIHHRPSCPETSMEPSDQGESSHQSHTMIANICLSFHTSDRPTDPSNPKKSSSPQDGVHRGDNLFSYLVCGKCFTENKNLVRHQRIYTSERSYSCSECGKCLTGKGKLLVQRRYHMVESPVSCSECGKCFSKKKDLLVHQRIHTGERPYSCTECGKCYTRKGALYEHRRVHTGVRPYLCSECGKSFTDKKALLKHHRTHTGERPYSCSECGKAFANKDNLVTHQKIHTGECRYSCPECGKCFNRKDKLATHQKVHTGERPYLCSECGKSFIHKADLVKHQKIHTGDLPYSCPECGKSFIYKGDLVKHQKIHTRKRP